MPQESQHVLDLFIVEARELLEAMTADVLDLEEGRPDPDAVHRLFRAAHTLKGNARMFGFEQMGGFAHRVEDLLSTLRTGEKHVGKGEADALLKAIDVFTGGLDTVQETGTEPSELRGAASVLERVNGLLDPTATDIASQSTRQPPAVRPAPAQPAPPSQPVAPAARSPSAAVKEEGKRCIKSLVVDDDFISRQILVKFLSRYGTVHVAVDGEEAVEGFASSLEGDNPERYDLVCMDVMMPRMDGMEAAKRIRVLESLEDGKEAVLFMITAHTDPKTVVRCCYDIGADYYLVKPVVLSQFENLLQRYGLIGAGGRESR